MFILYSLTFIILFFIIISFSIITVLNRKTYSDFIDALDSKKNKLKVFFPFGFYILDKFNYSFASNYDRKLLNYICEIFGQEYSAFYLRALYSKKIVLTALLIIGELAAALVFKFDGTILVYILLITVVFWFSDDRRLKNEVMNRRLEMQLEFPNFINKLTLLLNAGMTMSKAWEKISDDRIGDTDEMKGVFYTEVLKTVTELRTGKNEAEAYSQFAKRVKTPEISRLMSTILQNTKKGGNDLVLSLRLQSSECWEMRKNAIRRLGEEASTKLLLPMMIMFFAIIIIVVTPAILSMQGATTNF